MKTNGRAHESPQLPIGPWRHRSDYADRTLGWFLDHVGRTSLVVGDGHMVWCRRGAIISALSFAIFPKSSRSTGLQALVFLAVGMISYGIAMFGKREFVGSYAEDAFAGRLWYLGFIAFCIAVFCTLAALARFGRWNRKELD